MLRKHPEIVSVPQRIKGAFFLIKEMEKSIKLKITKYGISKFSGSGSSPYANSLFGAIVQIPKGGK